MTKQTIYRGISYSIAKGQSIVWPSQTRPVWHGVVFFDGGPGRIPETETKTAMQGRIEREINVKLDYAGDHRLYHIVENLVAELTRHDDPWQMRMRGEEPRRIPPTVAEMRARLHKVCEITERILITRYADSDRAALIEKLRAMTVERGCSPAEAAAAAAKLRMLEARV
jgi:hypothetical protein